MIRHFIISFLLVLGLNGFGQKSIRIPAKVEITKNKLYCDYETKYVRDDNQGRFYYYTLLKEGTEYNVCIDSSGFWFRTFIILDLDSVPVNCISTYNKQKDKIEQENEFPSVRPQYNNKLTGKKYKLQSVYYEYNSQNTEGYYEFYLSKPIAQSIENGDTSEILNIKKIKINRDGELLNNDGKKVVKLIGEHLMGETYFNNDPTDEVVTIEYLNGKKNGVYIQYFKYPNEIASVDYYVDDIPKGPFFSYWRNGKIRSVGYFENGARIISDVWTSDGNLVQKHLVYDSLTNKFMDNKSNIMNGCVYLQNAKACFSNGKVDSLIFNKEITENYVDSIRTYSFSIYGINEKITNRRLIKLLTINFNIDYFEGYATLYATCTYGPKIHETVYYKNSSIIKEEGYFENSKLVGNWNYYDEKSGKLIKRVFYENGEIQSQEIIK